MHEPRLVAAYMLCQMGQKCDNVVFCNGFDLVNPRHIKFDIFGFPDCFSVFARDHPKVSHGITGMRLDLVPDAELGFRGPDRNHLGAGITGNHVVIPLFWGVLM